jgi:hypothetical protein
MFTFYSYLFVIHGGQRLPIFFSSTKNTVNPQQPFLSYEKAKKHELFDRNDE